jgi:RNA-binding protein
VQKEIDAALNAHGLIKVRVLATTAPPARLMYQQLAAEIERRPHPAHWQAAGAVAPQPVKERAIDEDRMPGPKT